MNKSNKATSKTKESYFTLRFPIEWEERIGRLRKALDENKSAAVLQVRDSAVVRKAAIIGMRKLLEKYQIEPEVERE
jgi:hypothetical protein